MIRQLAHVCFFTDQIAQMVDFYRDGLGLPVQFTLDTSAGELMGYYFSCGSTSFIEVFDQALAIAQWGGQTQELTAGSRFRHICLEVTQLDQFIHTLGDRGIQTSSISTGMDGSRQSWIKDPDGNAIELMEYTDHSKQLHHTRSDK